MKQNIIEIWVGLLMLLGVFAFIFMALTVSGLSMTQNPFEKNTYTLTADFTDLGSLKVRSAVRIAGVQVGVVSKISLDPQTYQAHVVLSMDKNIVLPTDTSASITASGILGDNYVSLTPGFAAQNLANQGQITTTYAATSLQSLISTFMSGSKKTS